MSTKTAIAFCDVCFSYENTEVLHNVGFVIEPGSFVGVVGPNGGGKTTLLKLMLGLIRPERGAIEILGLKPREARPRIGYVMQHLQYDAGFPASVDDVVLMGRSGRHVFGRYGREDRRQAAAALETVGMAGTGKRQFGELSGGQQQRVLIAQALASQPDILLLDEPTANIDTDGEKAVHDLLASLPAHMTVVSVSHNVNMVINTVSHVLCVNKTASLGPIEKLSPDMLADRGAALLHHDAACHVFDHSHVHDTPHRAEANIPEQQPS